MATKNTQQPANGTRSATDIVVLTQQLDESGAVIGIEATSFASEGTAGSAVPSKAVWVGGTDGTNLRGLKTDSGGELQIDVLSIAAGNNNIGDVDVASIATGSNAIGKLAANSGVDIGDVDVLSIAAGTNSIGNVGIIPRTTGGLTTYHLASAGSTNATVVKASAGQLFGWYIYNSNAAARKLAFHNTASAPTAGAAIYFSVVIPPTSAANVFTDTGLAFSTGIAITTVTGLADNDTAAVAANDLICNLWYS